MAKVAVVGAGLMFLTLRRPGLLARTSSFRLVMSPTIPWLRRIGLPSTAPVADCGFSSVEVPVTMFFQAS